MIVTEREAETKLCPFMQDWVIRGDEGSTAVYEPMNCQASKCMAWRWVDEIPTRSPDRRGACGMTMLLGVAT